MPGRANPPRAPKRSKPQFLQRIRAKPCASTPRRRNFRNSPTTNAGGPTPSVRSRTVAAKSCQFTWYWATGALPFLAVVAGTGDLPFGILFATWLLTSRDRIA